MNLPESLISRILANKCILFLGAGATKESGGLLGSELGDYIYKKVGDVGIDYREDLSRYTQQLVDHGYREDIENIVRERLKSLKPSKEFSKMANIPWKSIYTTNYDDLIEKSYSMQRYYDCILEDATNISSIRSTPSTPLYKINGDINKPYSEKKLLITLKDLKENEKNNEKFIYQLMKDLNDTFVFIGYSFNDPNEIVTKILDEFARTDRWESVKEKYVILPSISKDIQMDLDCYKIQYIKGTANEFFELLSEKSNMDYKAKLSALKFSANQQLQNMDPKTLNYVNQCFDVYPKAKVDDTIVDGKRYFRGDSPNWRVIESNYDVSKNITITNRPGNEINSSTHYLHEELLKNINEKAVTKVVLKGPAVSGKTTALYRCAYELANKGMQIFFYKQQAVYKEGLLYHVCASISEPIVIIVDNLYVDYNELLSMIDDAEKNNLAIVFVLAIRFADWDNLLSNYKKKTLEPFALTVEMQDSFDKNEAEHLVEMLEKCGVIYINNKLEKSGYIKRFSKNHNIIEVLLELTENHSIYESVCAEYDVLKNETKLAYGIVSLIYKYGMKLRWELLQHTISEKFDFSWTDFIDKIIKGDARGNLFQEEIQGNFYLSGRHRYISNIIVQIHYQGNYSYEIEDFKKLVSAAQGSDNDERFVGGILHAVLHDDNLQYNREQILGLLDHAIDKFENTSNESFVNHLKGEYLLSQRDYLNAIACFDTNIQNSLNEEYSLHSLGKSYYYLAQSEENKLGEFRIHIDLAIEKLLQGIDNYKKNEFYYSLLLAIFDYLEEVDRLSEKNEIQLGFLEQKAIKNIGKVKFAELKNYNKGKGKSIDIDM